MYDLPSGPACNNLCSIWSLKHAPEAHFTFTIHYCDISYLSHFYLPLPLLLALQMHDAFHDYVDCKLLGTGPCLIIFGVNSSPGFRALCGDSVIKILLYFS